jgi:hypothetical protein
MYGCIYRKKKNAILLFFCKILYIYKVYLTTIMCAGNEIKKSTLVITFYDVIKSC